MNARVITALACAAVAVTAVPASAAPKTMKETYAVSAPVPFPVMEDQPPTMYGCIDGEEGMSKNTHPITLPAAGGQLKVDVKYTGDWDLYVLDEKGSIVAAAETTETGNTGPGVEKVTWKKGKKGQKLQIVVCNWMGLADATVSYAYTYGR